MRRGVGEVRTMESRKWDEQPSGKVEDPHCRSLPKIKTTDPSRLSNQTARRNLN